MNPSLTTRRLAALLCLLCQTPLHAADAPGAAPVASAAEVPSLVLSEDGSHVIDQRAQLIWPRCVEGMQWTGKACAGQALRLDYTEAVAWAHARWKAEGLLWRLPRANELKRLVDKTTQPPGLNPQLFPAAPSAWYWSSTSNIRGGVANPYNYGTIMQGAQGQGESLGSMRVLQGWAVNLDTGEARGDAAKSSQLPVRLVRPLR